MNEPVKEVEGQKKSNALIDSLQEDVAASFLEGIMPKLKPLIEKAMESLGVYLGNNDKIFLMRKLPGKKIQVFVFDNNQSNYHLSNDVDRNPKMQFGANVPKNGVEPDGDATLMVIDGEDFITKLISGEFKAKQE